MRSKSFGFLLSAALIFAVAFGVALKVSAAQTGEAIQLALISAGASLPASQSVDPCISASSKWALWTGGSCLRGANVPLEGGPNGVYTQVDFNALSAMGANVVRFGATLYSETAPYALNTTAQTNLDSMLDMVKKANMFAIITFSTGPGRNFDPQVPPGELHSVWTDPAAQTAWVDMWKYTAERYKDNPIVVGYELMNEPNSNEIFLFNLGYHSSNPSDFYPANANTLYDWNPLALRITTAIRQVDAITPILVAGMGSNAAAWMSYITPNGDSKTVYTFHQYEPSTYTIDQILPLPSSPLTYGTTTASCGTTPCTFTRANLTTQFDYVSSFKSSKNLTVANSEFGVRRFEPGADQWLNDSKDIMEKIGVNYILHDWEPAVFTITWANYDDFNYLHGTDPNIHVDVVPNPLTTVIKKYFQKNTVRPSNIGAVTQTGANNCAATVSSSLVMHIPVVTYSGSNYWADLQYNSGDSTLTVTDAGVVSDMSPYSNCTASTLSSDYKLHIPVIILNGLSYRADLQYGGSVFAVTGYGQN